MQQLSSKILNIKTVNGVSMYGSGNIAVSGVSPSVVTVADGSSITIDGSAVMVAAQVNTQATGTLTMNAPTGTLVDGQRLLYRIKSTNIQTFAWNAVFVGGGNGLPIETSGSLKTDYIGFIYNEGANKWHHISSAFGY